MNLTSAPIFMMLTTLLMGLSIIIMILSNNPDNTNQEKMSPFECGYTYNNLMTTHFSLRFFNSIIIFLIFDAELTLLYPGVLNKLYLSYNKTNFLFPLVILILLTALLYEQKTGSLTWMK